MRPQGGGGVDHPTKVQQRKAQTESRFSLSYYPWISSAKSKSLLQSSLSSLLISSANKTPRGISYPFQVPVGTIFSFMYSMYDDVSLSDLVRPYWSSTWLSSFHSEGYVNLDNYVLDYDFLDLFGYGFEWISYDIVSDDDLKFYDIL